LPYGRDMSQAQAATIEIPHFEVPQVPHLELVGQPAPPVVSSSVVYAAETLLANEAAEALRSPFGTLPNGEPRTRPELEGIEIHRFCMALESWKALSPQRREDFKWPIPLDSESFMDLRAADHENGRYAGIPSMRSFGGFFIHVAKDQLAETEWQTMGQYLAKSSEKIDHDLLFDYLPQFKGLVIDAETTDRLLAMYKGFYAGHMLEEPAKFTITDIDQFARYVVEIDDWWDHPGVQEFLATQQGRYDNRQITDIMIRAGHYGAAFLAENLEYFEDVDEAQLISDLLHAYDAQYHDVVLQNLYKFHDVPQDLISLLSSRANYPVRAYPSGASEQIRNKWFAEHAFVYLEGGFSKEAIGKIIRLRLEPHFEQHENGSRTVLLPVAENLHDASEYLSTFKIPEKVYDIAYILAHRDDPGFEPEKLEPVKLFDERLEYYFLKSLMDAPLEERQRLGLSTQPERIMQLFTSPIIRRAYWELVKGASWGLPGYKQEQLSWTQLAERIAQGASDYNARFTEEAPRRLPYTTERTTDDFWKYVNIPKVFRSKISTVRSPEQVPPTLRAALTQLKALGIRRKAYIDDTSTWLLRHATTPTGLLLKVWEDRAMALAVGERGEDGSKLHNIADKASDIAAWQAKNALFAALSRPDNVEALEKVGLSKSEVLSEKMQPWRDELTRVMSGEDTIKAIVRHAKWTEGANQPKVLASGRRAYTDDDFNGDAATWRFDVLDASDPRGFTIGADTGCCMTLGGLSASCIKAGYQSPNAGFVALYGPDSKLNAQSFWYVHPEHSNTLVLDNIEANQGRDYAKIVARYTKALTDILGEHNTAHPDRPITRVNIGEGYTDVKIGHLPSVDPVPKLYDEVYTDAARQRLLLNLG